MTVFFSTTPAPSFQKEGTTLDVDTAGRVAPLLSEGSGEAPKKGPGHSLRATGTIVLFALQRK